VLNYALATRSVLLLDEFDAIAKRRDDDSDVGELKRLVNVLLQAVDNWTGESLLVAATNHPDLLDPAIWRRFDLTLAIETPDHAMVLHYLAQHGLDVTQAKTVATLVQGEPFAHLERWLRAARKDALLNETPFMSALIGVIARDRSASTPGKAGRDLKVWSLHLQGKSAREIGKEVSLTHPTVQTIIKRLKGEQHGQE
jgi:ATP/maltotriose-dependent transcriptional regulator MalT